ncbi:Hypothetical predicted protein [Mytilus galloprovincialis]|uniref:Uncharacterized protein n=1 Tax=Mytilus galloprovincialis TaxID=29158 RepID=A0A8B6C007_MYTGA|nr:Hypothetical predicted protein [Mytilus galloprovincialis]
MKKLKRKEQKNKSYNKYKEKYNTSRIRSPKSEVSKSTLYKRNQRQKMKEQKEKQNQYKCRSRDKTQNVRQQNNQNDDIPNAIFKNKMAKSRALKRLSDALPASPSKKQAILKHYMCVSPTAKQSLKRRVHLSLKRF